MKFTFYILILSGVIIITPLFAQKNKVCPNCTFLIADKMNVFFVGVNNPISIPTTIPLEKLIVTATNGTLTPTQKYSFFFKPNGPGICEITVKEKGGSYSTFPFRCKILPVPNFYFLDSMGNSMLSDGFKISLQKINLIDKIIVKHSDFEFYIENTIT